MAAYKTGLELPDPGTIENGVLIGRDGYLFLAEGGHNVSEFVTGKREVEQIHFDIFRENLASCAAWAVRAGVQYLHLIMPDKQSIYPEAWTLAPPIRLGDLYVQRNPDFADRLIYPVALLSAHKPHVLTRNDTHLSTQGSMVVAAALVEQLSREPQHDMLRELLSLIDKECISTGDLGSKLATPVVETLNMLRQPPPGIVFSNLIEGGNNGGID